VRLIDKDFIVGLGIESSGVLHNGRRARARGESTNREDRENTIRDPGVLPGSGGCDRYNGLL
jgi:hypothetical protein